MWKKNKALNHYLKVKLRDYVKLMDYDSNFVSLWNQFKTKNILRD
jgi:hypothetical protein